MGPAFPNVPNDCNEYGMTPEQQWFARGVEYGMLRATMAAESKGIDIKDVVAQERQKIAEEDRRIRGNVFG